MKYKILIAFLMPFLLLAFLNFDILIYEDSFVGRENANPFIYAAMKEIEKSYKSKGKTSIYLNEERLKNEKYLIELFYAKAEVYHRVGSKIDNLIMLTEDNNILELKMSYKDVQYTFKETFLDETSD